MIVRYRVCNFSVKHRGIVLWKKMKQKLICKYVSRVSLQLDTSWLKNIITFWHLVGKFGNLLKYIQQIKSNTLTNQETWK